MTGGSHSKIEHLSAFLLQAFVKHSTTKNAVLFQKVAKKRENFSEM